MVWKKTTQLVMCCVSLVAWTSVVNSESCSELERDYKVALKYYKDYWAPGEMGKLEPRQMYCIWKKIATFPYQCADNAHRDEASAAAAQLVFKYTEIVTEKCKWEGGIGDPSPKVSPRRSPAAPESRPQAAKGDREPNPNSIVPSSKDFVGQQVQEMYRKLKSEYEWQYIRDDQLTRILIRDAEENNMDSTDVGPLLTAFYSEVDRINKKRQVQCFDVTYLEITFIPFILACAKRFPEVSVRDITDHALKQNFSFRVCQPNYCSKRLASRIRSTFPTISISQDGLANLCK